MKLVIRTQHEENYGAHCWDGEGECPQRWKFKGGDTYVVENATFTDYELSRDYELSQFVGTYINEFNEGWKEYAIATTLMEDDADIGIESWETPTVIKEKNNVFFAYRDTKSQDYWEPGFVAKHESWIMWDREIQPSGRSDYICEWTTDDGRRGTYEELKAND